MKQVSWKWECTRCHLVYSTLTPPAAGEAQCECGGRAYAVGGSLEADENEPLAGEGSSSFFHGQVSLSRGVKLGGKDGWQTVEPIGPIHISVDHSAPGGDRTTVWLECLKCGYRFGPCAQFLTLLRAGSSCPNCNGVPLYAADGKGDYRISGKRGDRIVIDDPHKARGTIPPRILPYGKFYDPKTGRELPRTYGDARLEANWRAQWDAGRAARRMWACSAIMLASAAYATAWWFGWVPAPWWLR